MRNQYEKVLEQQNNLKKKINMKVEAMSDKVEKEYKALIEKRDILETDKLTIIQNIEQLDEIRCPIAHTKSVTALLPIIAIRPRVGRADV